MAKQIYGRIPLWASLSAFFRFSTCNTHPQINIIIIMAARNGTQKPPRFHSPLVLRRGLSNTNQRLSLGDRSRHSHTSIARWALSSLQYRIATFALQRTFRFTPLGLAFCFFRFSNTHTHFPHGSSNIVMNIIIMVHHHETLLSLLIMVQASETPFSECV